MCELVSMRALRPLGRDDEMIMWTRTHTHVYVYERVDNRQTCILYTFSSGIAGKQNKRNVYTLALAYL